MSERAQAVLELKEVRRSFVQGGQSLDVLKGVSFALKPGEIVALTGPSGSGKSTLLHIAGLLERPSAGELIIDGERGARLGDRRRTQIRREKLGFVYQYHHLLREFSALENVVLPQMIAGVSKRKARARGRELLAALGLSAREGHRPARLSGGEQQRVAVARALANRPILLLADEPTGNLDHATADSVFDGLVALVRQSGLAALIATHNAELASRMDRRLGLEDGRVIEY